MKRDLLRKREMRKKIKYRMNERKILLERIRNLRKKTIFKTKERSNLYLRIKTIESL